MMIYVSEKQLFIEEILKKQRKVSCNSKNFPTFAMNKFI